MRLKRLFSAVLSAALLIGMCACSLDGSVVNTPPPRASLYVDVVVESSPVSGPTDPPEDSSGPVYTGPEYNQNHTLTEAIPPLVNGLELPVVGATGYTTVTLPLWPYNPNKAPEPGPTQAPSEPEPSPSEPEESVPPAEPTPLPSQFVDIVPPSTEPGPSSDPPTEPEPSSEPSSDPGPSAEPAPSEEPADTSEPEPEPDPANPYAGAVTVWGPGKAFLILAEDGDWWYVTSENKIGWISNRYCMINLPDVIPSIIYNDTNAYSSVFTAANGIRIPGVTDEQLYASMASNPRLDRQEFVMPILYSAARNICRAQHKALAEGNCLVIYQTFRPYDAQVYVANAVKALAKENTAVKDGISTKPWSIDWFIATGVSNHQRGYALDASMVKVYATETMYVGSYPYLRVTDYEDYQMPTPMHELSYAAAATTGPNDYSHRSPTMNEPAIALQNYFISSSLSLLPSEWWHFNDLAAMRATADNPSDGKYYTSKCLSQPPEWVSNMLLG